MQFRCFVISPYLHGEIRQPSTTTANGIATAYNSWQPSQMTHRLDGSAVPQPKRGHCRLNWLPLQTATSACTRTQSSCGDWRRSPITSALTFSALNAPSVGPSSWLPARSSRGGPRGRVGSPWLLAATGMALTVGSVRLRNERTLKSQRPGLSGGSQPPSACSQRRLVRLSATGYAAPWRQVGDAGLRRARMPRIFQAHSVTVAAVVRPRPAVQQVIGAALEMGELCLRPATAPRIWGWPIRRRIS